MAHSAFFAILCTLALLAPFVMAVDDSPEDSDVDGQHGHHCGGHGHHHSHDHPNHHHHPHHRHHHHHHHGPKEEKPSTNVGATAVDEVTQPDPLNEISNIFDVNSGQSVTNNVPADVNSNAVSSNDGGQNVNVDNKEHHQVGHDIDHAFGVDHVHGQEHENGHGKLLFP